MEFQDHGFNTFTNYYSDL